MEINDQTLLGKKIIKAADIYNILPQNLKEKIKTISLRIISGRPTWVLYPKDENLYGYVPHSGELIPIKAENIKKSSFFCSVKYQRKVTHYPDGKTEVLSEYFCLGEKMFLLGEIIHYWMTDDEGFLGLSSSSRFFRRYPD